MRFGKMETPMRAVILAGGKGTRLMPYTTVIPKPMVPLGNMAIMEIVIKQLVHYGYADITVSVNHMAQLIMAYFGDGSRWGAAIDYSMEDKPLSTIGPLKLMDDLPEHFLVMNGDVLTDIDYRALFETHVASGANATIATYERDVNIDFGVLGFDADTGRVVEFVEKPTEHFSVSMGVYVFSRRILDTVPDNVAYGFDNFMIDSISRGDDVRAFPFKGYWLDIGRPEDYDMANRKFAELRSVILPHEPDGRDEG